MKKLTLKALELSTTVLTREQLRNVVGGSVGTHCERDLDCNQYGVVCINNVCTYDPTLCNPGCTWGHYCLNGQCVS